MSAKRHVMPAAALLAVAAISAFLSAQSIGRGASPGTRSIRSIAGGTFEASGVAHVPGTAGVLFVDDGRHREIFWMEIGPDGSQNAPAVRIPLAADITDLEGITCDGTSFYVVGSQSKKTGHQGDGLVRFTFDERNRRIDSVERIQGLKAWLAAHVPELEGTAGQIGDAALNIEAVAWDPLANRLLLGLRAPVVDGHALIVPLKLKDARGAFSAANLVVAGSTIRLRLGGAGIRSLEYDTTARAFRVITGAGLNNEDRDFHILEWNGKTSPDSLKEIAKFSRDLKPEGITRAMLHGRPVSLVVFDTGRFALLD